MRPRSAWPLLLALALILGLLGVAFLQWRAMVMELDAMTAQLQSAAAGQRRLQRQLEETRRQLEIQKARLRALEAIEGDGAEHSLDRGEQRP